MLCTNCNGNYNAENKAKAFRLQQNPPKKNGWITIIPKENIPDSKYTVACERQLQIRKSYIPMTHT